MRRHPSADELASLAAGDMRARKATRISAHLAHCDSCRHLSEELDGVSVLLANTSFEAMPDSVSARIEAAIATEARQRVAREPATEAGRGELPARSRRTRQAGFRLPLLSAPMALRVAAVTGAAVVVVGGAYELADHALGTSSRSAPVSSSGVRHGLTTVPTHASAGFGPDISAGQASHVTIIRTETSNVNFTPAHLQQQVQSALAKAKHDDMLNANAAAGSAQPSARLPSLSVPGSTAQATRLSGCITRVAGARIPELVDIAHFSGKPATVIVVAAQGSLPGQVWVVGAGCSASASNVLDHQTLNRV